MNLTFGLDYDETFTADPMFWMDFIDLSKERGHKVVIVTYRDSDLDWTAWLNILKDLGVPVYCTAGVAKGWWMQHFGEPIHIWIDDKPERINENSKATPEFLVEWRRNREEVVPDREFAE